MCDLDRFSWPMEWEKEKYKPEPDEIEEFKKRRDLEDEEANEEDDM